MFHLSEKKVAEKPSLTVDILFSVFLFSLFFKTELDTTTLAFASPNSVHKLKNAFCLVCNTFSLHWFSQLGYKGDLSKRLSYNYVCVF